MKRAATLCLAATCFLWAASAAHASQISSNASAPTYWSYQFSAKPQLLLVGNSAHGASIFIPGGSQQNDYTAPNKNTNISTTVLTLTNATAGNPVMVSQQPFSLDLKIRDQTGATHNFIFTGTLNGDVWKSGSTLAPTFSTPLTQSYQVGSYTYQVKFDSFKTVSSGGGATTSEFVFTVDHHNPEPSSLVLAGIGIPLFGLIRRRRRRS